MKMKSPPKVCKKGSVLVPFIGIIAVVPFLIFAALIVMYVNLSEEEGKRLCRNNRWICTDQPVITEQITEPLTQNQ